MRSGKGDFKGMTDLGSLVFVAKVDYEFPDRPGISRRIKGLM